MFAVVGKVNGMNLSITIDAFKNGAKDLLPVCLIIGFAYSLIYLMGGSGQAALTMPIMSPLADLTGLSRQIAVLAFQLGDGWTHCIMPTSATLMAVLGVARIPYGLWLKFIFKFYLYLMTLSSIMVVICLYWV
ncbi:C4-dicarboxylate anaerobic carrier family protein [Francisella tularensis]|uniref:C4-dicarboxylate anaerobic carrier family protein n=2 Tax=Francisella tularensis TaxID=263 RepID=A0AAW3D3Q8_FRATU|nr:short-chain fatty acids transporter [Francisella tularensis subsp. tularensis NE061598]AJI68228.1 C4-dicarboxylate anaerobic carrier family protein [Francisella tularensis subsp. tularensis SCHU S4]AJI71144.1 C4-dicarboxylate anaerobic carrier family protein [Francisella tularensis subsp. tularensis]AKE20580.1 C4-dicarboxylate anaerobic carrier family protein [Francisella tularensis subsp. tularensis str. SCHU S4 substr. NR-28534]APS91723.1 hypothetical protein AV531_02455 [Francisella tular